MPDDNGQSRGRKRLRTFTQPKVLIPTVVAAVALSALLSATNVGEVGRIMMRFPPVLIPALAALFLGREFVRTIVWRYFLSVIGIKAKWRQAAITLTGSDATKVLPAGIYLQDVLVSRDLDTKISGLLAATTLMIWMELTISMIALAAIGLPAVPWFRWLMMVCGLGSLLVMLIGRTRFPRRMQERVHGWQEKQNWGNGWK
jgi:hypothetical protein